MNKKFVFMYTNENNYILPMSLENVPKLLPSYAIPSPPDKVYTPGDWVASIHGSMLVV